MSLSKLFNGPSRGGEEIKKAVRDRYAKAVSKSNGSLGECNSSSDAPSRQDLVSLAQYTSEELASLPGDAVENALGCGNPLAFAGVQPGDVVLDIGSGAGIDVLLAARIVGPTGKVIGIDMTPEMIEKGRENAAKAGVRNVEFRLGDAEQMPLDDSSVDWIISNCVINLAPDKRKVFSEVFRVLKPGGRVSISDMVTGQLPEEVRSSMAMWAHCIGGAIEESRYIETMREVGLEEIQVVSRQHYDELTVRTFVASNFSDPADREFLNQAIDKHPDSVSQVWSSRITARKPV